MLSVDAHVQLHHVPTRERLAVLRCNAPQRVASQRTVPPLLLWGTSVIWGVLQHLGGTARPSEAICGAHNATSGAIHLGVPQIVDASSAPSAVMREMPKSARRSTAYAAAQTTRGVVVRYNMRAHR